MEKLIGFEKINTAVFISGTGSNFKNLIEFSKTKRFGQWRAESISRRKRSGIRLCRGALQ